METIFVILFGFIVRAIVSAIRDRTEAISITPVAQSLCVSCAYAHIARGYAAGQELTYCTYAGVSREVNFAVSDCSMFCDRNATAPIVRVIGFANTSDQSFCPLVARTSG
ncbi:MAG TPA: hypothetical protein VN577_19620 [Terriglobales bacterium]|nr:hypothetical protein [Terriglobales bacterium]